MKLRTTLLHAGNELAYFGRAVIPPIFQSSTFVYQGETSYDDVKYIRLSNTPNHSAIHKKLAKIEQAEAAVVASSGMAAISTALMSFLKAGDHLLIQDGLYGGTYSFVTENLPRCGVEHTFVSAQDPASWKAHLRPNTKLFYVEGLSNPLLSVPELDQVVQFCRTNKLISMIDNTFLSPVNFQPCRFGFDIAVESATKYLNGHSDIVAGVVAGSEKHIHQIHHNLNHFGGTLDPHALFLLDRGLKTLDLRVRAQNENATQLAEFLQSLPMVEAVHYPTLKSHPQTALAKKWFSGFGGVFSFSLKASVAQIDAAIERLQIPTCAPSLGGVETLITRPCTTSHAGIPPQERARMGIGDNLVRVAVGIEHIDDLKEDFTQAFNAQLLS